MFKLNGTSLGLDTPFTTEDGTQYPANWLRLASLEEKAAIGITEEADAPSYDDRFYWGVDNPKQLDDVTETVDGVETTTKGLKSQWSAQIKVTANTLLQPTDWMVIRKVERNVDIPAKVIAYRAAVLAECDRILLEISTTNDVQTFKSVIESAQFSTLGEEK